MNTLNTSILQKITLVRLNYRIKCNLFKEVRSFVTRKLGIIGIELAYNSLKHMIMPIITNLHLNIKKAEKQMQAKVTNSDLKKFTLREKQSSYHLVCSVNFLPLPLLHPSIREQNSFILHLHRIIFPRSIFTFYYKLHFIFFQNTFNKTKHPIWRQNHLAMSTEPKSMDVFKKAQYPCRTEFTQLMPSQEQNSKFSITCMRLNHFIVCGVVESQSVLCEGMF